jgi:hypothetical protein
MITSNSIYTKAAIDYMAEDPFRPVSAQEISEKLGIPKAFTSLILTTAAKKSLIKSVRGRGGGFLLLSENNGEPVVPPLIKVALVLGDKLVTRQIVLNSPQTDNVNEVLKLALDLERNILNGYYAMGY